MLPITPGSLDFDLFAAMLREVCTDLARQVVRDGEGATRLFRVEVRGAPSDAAAHRVAREVVNSPLVKCAVHGRDPNWGRIVTAAGNAGVPFNPDHASLSIGPVEVYASGLPRPEALADPRLAEAMRQEQVDCLLTIGGGPGRSWMLGCDLTAKYVSINADYTT
jgi:glutamate N-acetyltransferase/amino-acid N-acetyltransferase